MRHVLLAPSRRCGGRRGAPARSGASRRPESPRCSAAPRPSASTIDAIVDAVPMTLQVPVERDMQDSACMNSLRLISPALTSSLKRQTSVPEPIGLPRYLPFSIGPPETTIAGRSQLAAPMIERRRGLVAAAEQDDAVDRVAADRLLDVHRREVAEQHRGRPQARLAERHHRELERHAARLPDAALDVLGELAEVHVARRQLRPGVADADDRPAVEDAFGQPAAHPAAVDEAVLVELAEPCCRSVLAASNLPS